MQVVQEGMPVMDTRSETCEICFNELLSTQHLLSLILSKPSMWIVTLFGQDWVTYKTENGSLEFFLLGHIKPGLN